MEAQIVQPVILSGGAGTRLWPLSRPEQPKQLLPLTDAKTMLQLTAGRVQDEARFADPIVVCGEAHATQVTEQLAAIGIERPTLVVEPMSRNTAPAIALAALSVAPETTMLVMPSDHVIGNTKSFLGVIELARPAALDGWIVTFGIKPDRPETGYGYIHRGQPLTEDVYRVDRFVEKPNVDTARAYLAQGDLYWNGGIFLFRAADYLAALNEHAPDVLRATQQSLDRAQIESLEIRPDAEAFVASPSISIDYAVLEKVDRVAVAPIEMDWSDIGSWDALYDFSEKEDHGNVLSQGVIAIDTQSTLVRSTGPLVGTVGVKDLIILATKEAVLVIPRGESQRVKEIVEQLELSQRRGGEGAA